MASTPSLSASPDSFIFISDTLRLWPWPRHVNPHYLVCKKESSAWCESFRALSLGAQEAFNKSDYNLLASLAYPLFDKEECKIGCDLMNLFFFIDDSSDVVDKKGARAYADIIMNALRNPLIPRPVGEWAGGEMARQFWHNAMRFVAPYSRRRFIETFQSYMDAVVQQAEDRESNHIRNIESYFEIRRETIGATSALVICELHTNIPDEVMEHPVISKLTQLCVDMIILSNDLYSYNVEQARGDDTHNLVTIVMHQFQMDIQSAIDWISQLRDDCARQFLEQWKNIPTLGGPLDREIRTYCDGLGYWIRAIDSWSSESRRYFKDGFEIEVTRQLRLLPKSTMPK